MIIMKNAKDKRKSKKFNDYESISGSAIGSITLIVPMF